jgi:hypothetical protein
MTDAIVPKLKMIYRFDTNYQSIVENFCNNILNLTNRTFLMSGNARAYEEYNKYYIVKVDGRISKRTYKYRIG